jgi:LacI family transcriptional regulator
MKMMRIGLVSEHTWTYNRRVLHGLAIYCQARGWTLQLHAPTAETLTAIHGMADGFVLGAHPREGGLDRLLDRPTVSISGHRERLAFPQVISDDPLIGRMAADHLFDRGFRYLAFVGDSFGGWWSARRQAGFSDRARELGVSCFNFVPDQMARPGARRPKARIPDRACLAWLRKLPRPLGLMGCSDGHARYAIDLCHQLRLRVPEDVAVVGVDNDDVFTELTEPPLSSVALQTDRLGFAAGELLGRLLEGKPAPKEPVVIPPGELIVRRSSDTIAIGDPIVAGALRFIREHLPEQAGVKQLLAHIPVSRSNLDARFRAALGRSAAEEVRRARIGQAKHLLSASDLPVAQVAHHAGFSCARRLSEIFHRETGVTPSAYRRQFRLRGEL